MITRIRDVRRAKKLTLDDVARRCVPPTTAQTIGRLETGTRTVSVSWLNRIAAALEVPSSELIRLPDQQDIPVAALLSADGAQAPRRIESALALTPIPGQIAIRVAAGVGDYRSGDEIWAERLDPSRFGAALNRDVLVPRPGGRFLFGRMIQREADKLAILPLGAGGRQQVVTDPAWIAVATRLIRNL